MKRTLLPAALALAVLTSSLAFAQTQTAPQQPAAVTEGHHHRHDPHREAAKLTKKLNLTPDQSARLEPILADRNQKIQAIHQNTALSKDDRKQQIKAVHKDTRQQLEGVLTPDQLNQMKSLRHHGHKDEASGA